MNSRRGVAALLATAMVSIVLAVVNAQPASADSVYIIKNYGSGMCVQPPPEDPFSFGLQLVQEPCDTTGSTVAQLWSLKPLGSNVYQFVNQSRGGCMDAHGPNANRTPVDTWPCSGISNQKWTVQPNRLVSAVGGRCLDVAAGSLQAGAPIQIYGCTNNNTAQIFFVFQLL